MLLSLALELCGPRGCVRAARYEYTVVSTSLVASLVALPAQYNL